MSKHISRKEQWLEISPTKFTHMHGYVEANSFGMWDAILVFKQRTPLPKKGIQYNNKALIESLKKLNLPNHLIPKLEEGRPWRKATKHCGEHKRARQAMMALEDAIKKFQADNNPDKIL